MESPETDKQATRHPTAESANSQTDRHRETDMSDRQRQRD